MPIGSRVLHGQHDLLGRFRVASRVRIEAEKHVNSQNEQSAQVTESAHKAAETSFREHYEQNIAQAAQILENGKDVAEKTYRDCTGEAEELISLVKETVSSAEEILAELDLLDSLDERTPSDSSEEKITSETLREQVNFIDDLFFALQSSVKQYTRSVNRAKILMGGILIVSGIVLSMVAISLQNTASFLVFVFASLLVTGSGLWVAIRFWSDSRHLVREQDIVDDADDLQNSVVSQEETFGGRFELDDCFFEFVRIAAGPFVMGSNTGEDDEQPVHEIDLDEYWIGKTPVTNKQYRLFVESGGYEDESLWTADGWKWLKAQEVTQPDSWDDEEFNTPDQPVVGISWFEARAYVVWLSKEVGLDIYIPTEAEWEKAARGTDGRNYPWGAQRPNDDLANFDLEDNGKPIPVGSYPAGISPFGVLDMAGNVWEWTSSVYRPYPYDEEDGREKPESSGARVIRGGSWASDSLAIRTSFRDSCELGESGNDIGLRLVVVPE